MWGVIWKCGKVWGIIGKVWEVWGTIGKYEEVYLYREVLGRLVSYLIV